MALAKMDSERVVKVHVKRTWRHIFQEGQNISRSYRCQTFLKYRHIVEICFRYE